MRCNSFKIFYLFLYNIYMWFFNLKNIMKTYNSVLGIYRNLDKIQIIVLFILSGYIFFIIISAQYIDIEKIKLNLYTFY